MTIDSTGRAHKPAGSPASTGGQFAAQSAPGQATALLERPQGPLFDEQVERTATALQLAVLDGRERAEQKIRDTFPKASAYEYNHRPFGVDEHPSCDLVAVYDDDQNDLLHGMDEQKRQVLLEDFSTLTGFWAETDADDEAGRPIGFDQGYHPTREASAACETIDTGLDAHLDRIDRHAIAAHQSVALAKEVQQRVWDVAAEAGVEIGTVELHRATDYDPNEVRVDLIKNRQGDILFDRESRLTAGEDIDDLAADIGYSLTQTNEQLGGGIWLASAIADSVQSVGSGHIEATAHPVTIDRMDFRKQRGVNGGNPLFGDDSPFGDPLAFD